MPPNPRDGEISDEDISVDDLLKQQDGPARKKRRIMVIEDHDEGHTSDDRASGKDVELNADTDEESEDDGPVSSVEVHNRFQTAASSRIPERPEAPDNQQPINSKRPSFASLGVSAPLVNALKGMSIKMPTEVQEACIPPLLAGKYVFATILQLGNLSQCP
jgi:hypothetical protein